MRLLSSNLQMVFHATPPAAMERSGIAIRDSAMLGKMEYLYCYSWWGRTL